ncbi:SpdD-like protein [Streptomyces boninensis]|uniref:SpdD-like protein n=1 Tax=Streptomyces boninensis TaxID=2039455 RepID=UPI003B20D285
MFRPKYPTAPVPTSVAYPPAVVTPTAIEQQRAAGCGCQNTAPPQHYGVPTPGSRISAGRVAAYVAGGTTVLLVVGAVLVSMLIAVAISACAVTGCLLVLRSMFTNPPRDTARHHR